MVGCRNCNQPLNPQWNVCPNCSTPTRGIKIQDSVVMGNVSNTNVTNVQHNQAITQLVVPEGPTIIYWLGIVKYTRLGYNIQSLLALVILFIFLPLTGDIVTTIVICFIVYGIIETIIMNILFNKKDEERRKLMRQVKKRIRGSP